MSTDDRSRPPVAEDGSPLFCSAPFDWLEVHADARAYVCCPSWLPKPIGSLKDQSVEEVWNGETAREIRASILDGSFRYCDKTACPWLQARRPAAYVSRAKDVVEPRMRRAIDDQLTELPWLPRGMNCSFDRSCNLSCPSCRTELIVETHRADEILALQNKLDAELLPTIEKLYITGSGDPFGSPYFRRWLRSMRRERMPKLSNLHLHSNGQLWTRENWEAIPIEIRDTVHTAEISIDAASDETYALNRRGGNFQTLLQNLELLSELRVQKKLKALLFSMVVQANNFREMPAFIELGKRFDASGVYFMRIDNWGTYSDEDFRRRAVHEPSHPEHDELLRTLLHPSLASRYANLGNLSELRRRAPERIFVPLPRAPDDERLFCSRPFEWLHVGTMPMGESFLCVPWWSRRAAGNLRGQSVAEVWNGEAAREIRASIFDGSFRYCEETLCPYLRTVTGPVSLVSEVSDARLRQIIAQESTTLPDGPLALTPGFDRSCESRCPSCRPEKFRAPSEAVAALQKKLEEEALPRVERLVLSGPGEILDSVAHRAWLERARKSDVPALRQISVVSNGLGWTRSFWASIAPEIRALLKTFQISIDAASPETYALNRPEGDFSSLLENLAHLAEVRRSGSIEKLCVSMVVQQNNFREMPAFVALGRRLKADRIVFASLEDWRALPNAEYLARAVHLSGHPEHDAYLAQLQSPELRGPDVDLDSLQAAAPPAPARPRHLPVVLG